MQVVYGNVDTSSTSTLEAVPEQTPEELFTFRLLPPRPTFTEDMTDAEGEVMSTHFAYWLDRFEDGDVVIFGLVLEPESPWGLCVVRATDREAVVAMAEGDPAVSSGTCTYAVGTMPRAYLAS
jgi:hypothetical protein